MKFVIDLLQYIGVLSLAFTFSMLGFGMLYLAAWRWAIEQPLFPLFPLWKEDTNDATR